MKLLIVGLSLIVLGVGILFVTILSAVFSSVQLTTGVVSCIVILFIPICFGAGNGQLVTWGMTIAGILLLTAAVLQWLLWKRQEKQ